MAEAIAVVSAYPNYLMESNNKNLTQALEYLKRGWSVLPLRPNEKKPLGEWKKYQKQYATEEEVRAWFEKYPDISIGIVTGLVSKIIVVDIDPQHGGEESAKKLHLPPTYMVKTGGGGAHYYYRWGKDTSPPNRKGYLEGVDIQGEGAYVVAPPSMHQSGNRYEAVNSIDELVDAPEWLYEWEIEPKEKAWEISLDGVQVGKRNEAAASLIGKALSKLPKSLWEIFGWPGIVAWNERNEEPLPEQELRSVFDSIAKRADQNREEEPEKASIAKQIVDLVMKSKPDLFHNDLGRPFARIQVDDHWETHPLDSKCFRQWVTHLYYTETGKPPNGEHIKQALDVLESIALFEGEELPLATRVTKDKDTLWYDLVDDEWQAIKVTKRGWEVINTPPTLFVRYSHQKSQVLPQSGGLLSRILDFVNISDPDQRLLFQVYMVSCFVPGIPHPVPILYGSQGSAKSTCLKIIRRIVDPSALELLTFPTKKEELVQQLSHHWTALYDNITFMPEWLSDSLCRAVTGEGFSKRELYSNDADVIYAFRSCIGLNGINLCATKADLLDRSILFGLERIQPQNRRDEQTFWDVFEECRPAILGAVFDALAKAMAIRPTVNVNDLPRMADFTLWGCAIADALGYTQDEFLVAYRKNIDRQNEEAIHEHPVATAVVVLMESREEWTGTPTELLGELNMIAENQKMDTRQRLWPKASQALTKRLNEARTNLETIGIGISIGSQNHNRRITVCKNPVGAVVSLQGDTTDGADGDSETKSGGQETLDLIREHLDPNARFTN